MIESGDGFTGNRQYEYRAGGSTAGTKTDSIDFQIMILDCVISDDTLISGFLP
jgi:hypothetical protein